LEKSAGFVLSTDENKSDRQQFAKGASNTNKYYSGSKEMCFLEQVSYSKACNTKPFILRF
jgi:hypothetical protein